MSKFTDGVLDASIDECLLVGFSGRPIEGANLFVSCRGKYVQSVSFKDFESARSYLLDSYPHMQEVQ